MSQQNFRETASFLWSIADLLRGNFKQSQYGRIILPFTVLRRLELVLAPTRAAVLKRHTALMAEHTALIAEQKSLNQPQTGLPDTVIEKELKKSAGASFYNTSPIDLAKLGQNDAAENLVLYINSFSKEAAEIFAHFRFEEFIAQLNEVNLLYKVAEQFDSARLSPADLDNHHMGLVFEDLIRRFAESSNETAGEHFTPRDIVHLTTALLFMPDDAALSIDGTIRTIYDPTAGTGGFLSSGMDYVHDLNPKARLKAFGQELNPESYAICMADMMIKGQAVENIKLGNTLNNDQLPQERFNYMLSNPPFGVDWKGIQKDITDEHSLKGMEGRFGAGLPRVSDGSLLFLLHLISKMRPPSQGDDGSRIGIILNGSPLFTGSAGSGESEIRRFILEHDYLEAIIALPNDMFYNTGIATYIWILSNNKQAERLGKVQLINGENLYGRMRKSLGSKRNEISDAQAKLILADYHHFSDAKSVDPETGDPLTKILPTAAFGYRRVTIERPLRLAAQFSDGAIATLRFSAHRALNAPMQRLYEWLVESKISEAGDYKALPAEKIRVRALLKEEFSTLKEADIKKLLDPELWETQRTLMATAEAIRAYMGDDLELDFNRFTKTLDKALKSLDLKLSTADRKLIENAVTWRNPDAAPVIKQRPKNAVAHPLYGLFDVEGVITEYESDSELRDNENIPLDLTPDAKRSVAKLVEDYVVKEVLPHVPDAWINNSANYCDPHDKMVGVVGYEIPFNRHFYRYTPPRDLKDIDADLARVSSEIMRLLEEVKS